MGKLVKKDGKFLKKDGKFVTTDNPANCPCCGGDPCPPGKFCIWTPPDQCATGKCTSYESDDPIECPFPYDCTSEQACNQWYEQNPNPPCDCWVCVDGEWVNQKDYAAECSEKGGYPGSAPPEGVECKPPVKYICATRTDSCGEFPLNYGQWQYNSFGQWVIRRSRCASQFPADTCTIADAPQRPGTPGEIVNVGCKAVTPDTTKECITEEEFNKGGWIKVSGPHDTLEICEADCNPPPPPVQLWCCDGGAEGYFCGERVNVPGIGEMIGDAPIDICTSVNKVDDCVDCGPPEPPCDGESEQGTWQLELCDEEDCKYVTCGQSGSGVGPKFLTQQACRDCHNLRETCSLDHPLCVLNRNPLP
jgi:hypothetical protein